MEQVEEEENGVQVGERLNREQANVFETKREKEENRKEGNEDDAAHNGCGRTGFDPSKEKQEIKEGQMDEESEKVGMEEEYLEEEEEDDEEEKAEELVTKEIKEKEPEQDDEEKDKIEMEEDCPMIIP